MDVDRDEVVVVSATVVVAAELSESPHAGFCYSQMLGDPDPRYSWPGEGAV